MRYQYTLTYRDYLTAQKLYRSHRWTSALSYYLWIWALPIAGALLALPFLAGLFGLRRDLLPMLAGGSAVGLWFAIFIPAMRVYTIRKCWRNLLPESSKKSTKTTIPVELEMTPDQLISALPGKSEGRFFWPTLVDCAENSEICLVFIKKKLFLFIPIHALDETGWAELHSRFESSREKV